MSAFEGSKHWMEMVEEQGMKQGRSCQHTSEPSHTRFTFHCGKVKCRLLTWQPNADVCWQNGRRTCVECS